MLFTPNLSTQFVNNCCALSKELAPTLLEETSQDLGQPQQGQRAWHRIKRRWVNVHAQLSPFSYVSWTDLVVSIPTLADVWHGETLEDLLYVSQVKCQYSIVATQDLLAPGGECAVLDWPHLQEDFECEPAYQLAAGKTSWADSHAAASGY